MQKKILFICPQFHDYENEVIKELTNKGYDVTPFVYNERKHLRLNLFFKAINKLSSRLFNKSVHHFINATLLFKKFNNDIEKLSNTEYDRLLVIKGFGISKDTIKKINAKKKLIYQWDPLSRYPHIHKIYNTFDSVYTFDTRDSYNGFGIYLPNFIPANLHKNTLNTLKIFYIGSYIDYRYDKLLKIKEWCDKEQIPYELTLINKRKQCPHGLLKNKSINISEYRERFSQASIILEMSRPSHNGYTQRYYEAIFSEKIVVNINSDSELEKLINTTKEDVCKLKPISKIERKKLTNPLLIGSWLERILN